jgi:hypothetical protein
LKSSWAEPDVRDEVVDYVRYWSDKTGIKATKMIRWIGIHRSKYYDWLNRYGRVNEHNSWIPRDFWLTSHERQAIIDYYHDNPLEGYRRLTYMMMDADIVAVSPSSVYRVLTNAGLLNRWNRKQSKKAAGFCSLRGAVVFYPGCFKQIFQDSGFEPTNRPGRASGRAADDQ